MKPGINNISILIAEDSRTQAEQLSFLLEQHDYQVTIAANGKQALLAAQKQKPTLIISDVVMPEMDGYALCKAIKTDEKLKDIPVILVTTLSDARDVIRGLECGADNFIRKPYEERYLLSRINYLLMNLDLRREHKMQVGVEINLGGQKYFINSERQQILDLLISTYEQAVHINNELKLRETELEHSYQVMNGLYRIAEGLNQVSSEREVAEIALERALELPGVEGGWVCMRDGETGFQIVASRNLPPALTVPGAMDGDCACRRQLISGKLGAMSNIIECERIARAKGDTNGLRYHATVPLWIGDRTVGLMNLVGVEQGLFDEAELKVLHGVGNQVAVAMERARLHEHLEQLVEERTAALTTEIAERKQAEAKLRLFRTLLDNSNDSIEVLDPVTLHFSDINETGCRVLGYSREELLSMSAFDIDIGVNADSAKVIEAQLQQSGRTRFETVHRRKDGSTFPVEVSATLTKIDKPYLLSIARDITLRKAQEAKIARLNRIYAVLSGINTTIVRVHEEDELFREACRIAVDHGRFVFAWIGKFDAASEQVTPVAQAGRDEGYLAQINLTARNDASGSCALLAQALTETRPVICNDIAADGRMGEWQAEALKRDYHSVVVLPLVLEGKSAGVFVLYAPEPGVFDDEEMRLLIEMAGDISFAMNNLVKEEKLNYLAYYDVITGLPNRALFYDRLDQHLRDAQRDETIAVLAIDLERFRGINETFGRHAGDELLKQVAERLISTGVGVDHLARISGDCFAMALTDLKEGADMVRFFENQVTAALNRPFQLEGQELRISVRAGIAIFPDDGKDADTLFRNAEAALKKTKLLGDRYLFYTPALNARVAETLMLENKLRRALEQDQLVLHYQPKVDLKTNQIVGVEALMRWNDPDGGLVPPAKFIPLLEETGMIVEVGAWALTRAMTDFRDLQSKHLSPPRIAVNVSQIQLQRSDFVSTIARVLSELGDVSGGLEIEITESLIMQDIEANIMKLNAIREMGVEIAIDDFGTGYSSLSYIAKLPVNLLKIDRAFIINMTTSADDLSIVSAIISLAHSLNLRVVAEGVETHEQASLLRLLKCDEIQGFLFSPGVPVAQLEEFLRNNKTLLIQPSF
ncbi:MAG: EAL domain-containing protein [Sulfuriferula sp.]